MKIDSIKRLVMASVTGAALLVFGYIKGRFTGK